MVLGDMYESSRYLELLPNCWGRARGVEHKVYRARRVLSAEVGRYNSARLLGLPLKRKDHDRVYRLSRVPPATNFSDISTPTNAHSPPNGNFPPDKVRTHSWMVITITMFCAIPMFMMFLLP